MIQSYSRLKVADNTGAKEVMCIRVLGNKKQAAAKIGDIITVSVKKSIPQANVKKKTISKAIIVRQAFTLKRKDGSAIRFDDNAVVLLDNELNPIGTRILGPVARELKSLGYSKICSLAPEIL